MVEARPVRVVFGCGQWACQVPAAAKHLQPSEGRGRVRRRARAWAVGDSVLKKVKLWG